MSKHAMISNIATKTGESQRDVSRILEALGQEVAKKLATAGEEITLPGIGKLKAVQRAARVSRNPSTGEPCEVPARLAVKFVPAKALKDALN